MSPARAVHSRVHRDGHDAQSECVHEVRLRRQAVHSYQRPDADHVEDFTRTSLNGNGGFVSISKIAGSKVRFNSNVGDKSPGLDINDAGFMQRVDVRTQNNWLQWRNDTPSSNGATGLTSRPVR